ncbi:MAG: Do family serine endopeptidase [Gammaproteobacteria bacterium]|nr:serine endoprotease DegQ [Chromatiales bacterium]MCP4925276.1 Do family serine endopeptidase [Gammaproteobacteria bacterium]MDP7153586.1 Do family serine endopeptidase [Gammaproteobacteria bacterium]MDP7296257.1 Do family serine endopeptidase [Gammaproteobacteria bacterium]MDP7419008.1 Do family serine endopeptidase [Gammaproteobacteria bacterium]
MKTAFKSLALALTTSLLMHTAGGALPVMLDDQPLPSLAPLVSAASPAVVSIATRGKVEAPRNPLADDPFFQRFFGTPQQRQREVRSAGSGVIIDAISGYILTNHHVIEHANEIEIKFADKRSLKATVVGSDPGTDIAVLQVEDTNKLVQMPLGNSEQVEVGDFVVAIGNPFGLSHTVTSGIVSALGRTGLSQDGYEDFIQTDASINPGNSGGALINLGGELIGINSAIFSGSGGNIGIGFAIPVNIAKSIMVQLIEHGEVQRGLLGVSISNFNAETAAALGIEDDVEGALVNEVVPDSAAESAGIAVSDIIIAVDNNKVTSASDLRTTIGLRRSGDAVRITLIRDGNKLTLNATLTQLDSTRQLAAAEVHPALAGAEFENYTGQDFSDTGVLVSSVEPRSPAAQRGLRSNDIITTLNRQRVNNIRELGELAADQNLLILGLRRGQRNLLLQIR